MNKESFSKRILVRSVERIVRNVGYLSLVSSVRLDLFWILILNSANRVLKTAQSA